MQNRWKSPILWGAVLSYAVFLSRTYFGYEVTDADKLIDGALNIAILVGIINNPTNKGGL